MVVKRLFTALNYPKGSKERVKLNNNIETSEYFTSYKWGAVGGNYSLSFKTKKEAENFEEKIKIRNNCLNRK